MAELNSIDILVDDTFEKIPTDQLFTKFLNLSESYRSNITSVIETVSHYENYRFGLAIAIFLVLVAVIGANLVGFAGGVGGFDARATPINRSWCSDIGGKSLMISVWISFGFSWLLMALVASTFTVGGHGERYICENFTPPDLIGPEVSTKFHPSIK